jgi:hypothetical protein
MNTKIGLKLVDTAIPGFHSLNDWHFLRMWLCSSAPTDPEDETVMEKHSTEALDCDGKSLIYAMCSKV